MRVRRKGAMSFDLFGREVHTFCSSGVRPVSCGIDVAADVTGLVEYFDPIQLAIFPFPCYAGSLA